ncbi:MAG: peptidylprolyl isomerase, partial [Clostridia bacterium]|nr:peptidylprolyl isomerase [Clostridia bacterium]
MKRKLVARFLLTVLSVSLMLTGCSKPIMTARGEDMKAGYYSFYVHWQRDYYKELLKGYGYDIAAVMDNYFTEKQTVRESILSSAKDQYLTFVIVSEKFEELGLALSEDQIAEIEKQYNDEWIKTYGEKGMKTILKTLKLDKEEFLNLLAVDYKSNAILDYYYGENGITPITEQAKKDYYDENFHRFKYVLLTTEDEDGKSLPAEEIARKRNLAESICQKVKDGASFEDLLKEHSEDYVKITDDMSESDKASAEKNNQDAVTIGLICDQNGIFNQTLYNYYDIAVNGAILSKLDTMENND